MRETWVRSLSWEDALEKGKATHSSILAWVTKSRTWLSDFHFHFHFLYLFIFGERRNRFSNLMKHLNLFIPCWLLLGNQTIFCLSSSFPVISCWRLAIGDNIEHFPTTSVKATDSEAVACLSSYHAAAVAKSLHSCPTLCDPIDGSPPGSPIPGILQARTLEWIAISFSNAWKWKVNVKSLRHVRLLATPWTTVYQAPPSMGFPRQEYWSGLPLPSPSSYHRQQFYQVFCLALQVSLAFQTLMFVYLNLISISHILGFFGYFFVIKLSTSE